MKLLILGASGMAGHLISTYFNEKNHEILTLSSRHPFDKNTTLIDVCNINLLESYLKSNNFDIIINCIGMLIDACEKKITQAILINAYLPHFLEKLFQNTSTRIIHLSTDCVFSGANGPYYENSPYDGQLIYDRSKALGEINNPKDLTLRMSIIGPDYSSKGIGLLNWFLQQQGKIYGYTNVYWNGITTLELAKGIEAAIAQNLTGLYHLTSEASISKYHLLSLVKQTFTCNQIELIPKEVVPINKTLINSRKDFKYTIPLYSQMLKELYEWIMQHPSCYPSYYLPTMH